MDNLCWDELVTPIGAVGAVGDDKELKRIYFCRSGADLQRRIDRDFPGIHRLPNPLTTSAIEQISDYFAERRTNFDLPLSRQGFSRFALRIRDALEQVPFGHTVSYQQLAKLSGAPRAARAVGNAMAANPFPIVVPCHRVIKSDGQEGRYSGANGTLTKRWLIDFERRGK